MGQSFTIGALLPLRLRLWLGRRLFRDLGRKTVRVSWHRVIKGPCDPGEIEAMQYVAAHTTIPIPKIYAIHTDGTRNYIEMAHIPGVELEEAWPDLSKDQKSAIFVDIKQYLSQLRELQPPAEDVVCSALQNPAYDCRIGFQFFGPMNHQEFHTLVRKTMPWEHVERILGQEVATVHSRSYRTCFTHGDLAPRNIMIHRGRVAAIIDWGFSGWYPEYWEFTRAHYNYYPGEDWEDYLRDALPPYEMELAAERMLWKILPEPGSRYQGRLADGTEVKYKGSAPSPAWLNGRAGTQPDLWSLALTRTPGGGTWS